MLINLHGGVSGAPKVMGMNKNKTKAKTVPIEEKVLWEKIKEKMGLDELKIY